MLVALLLLAQEAAPAVRDLGPWLAARVARDGMPALAALVTDGERTLAAGASGVCARGGEDAAAGDDRWHIGSCTKSMTASVAAMLVADGLLSWDSTPASVFPEAAARMDPAWQGATLARLLSHTAGADGDVMRKRPQLWARLRRDGLTPAAQRRLLLDTLTAEPPEQPPGAGYLYSNSGYVIAGAMMERASGQSYEELMRARLFAPLGMDSAGFGAPAAGPRGHGADGRPVPPGPGADNPEALAPAGRVSLTLEDWAKYARWHMRPEKEQPLLQRLHAPVAESGAARYALGWISAEFGPDKTRLLGHSGSNTLWYAVIWILPERGLAVLTACNDGARGPAMERITAELLQEFP